MDIMGAAGNNLPWPISVLLYMRISLPIYMLLLPVEWQKPSRNIFNKKPGGFLPVQDFTNIL